MSCETFRLLACVLMLAACVVIWFLASELIKSRKLSKKLEKDVVYWNAIAERFEWQKYNDKQQ